MPNPNEVALAAILEKIKDDEPDDTPAGLYNVNTELLARLLAMSGVLVISPEVLTDEALEQCGLLDYASEWGGVRTTADEGARVRSGLARLASGGTTDA